MNTFLLQNVVLAAFQDSGLQEVCKGIPKSMHSEASTILLFLKHEIKIGGKNCVLPGSTTKIMPSLYNSDKARHIITMVSFLMIKWRRKGEVENYHILHTKYY